MVDTSEKPTPQVSGDAVSDSERQHTCAYRHQKIVEPAILVARETLIDNVLDSYLTAAHLHVNYKVHTIYLTQNYFTVTPCEKKKSEFA